MATRKTFKKQTNVLNKVCAGKVSLESPCSPPATPAHASLIPLTRGQFAIVDSKNYEWLNQWKWHATKCKTTYYAVRHDPLNHKKLIRMHRIVIPVSKSQQIDHINHNGLCNQEDNLRVCDQTENNRNARPWRNCSSAKKGVSWNKGHDKWSASITVNKRKQHLGYFSNEKKAASAYDEAAKKLFGEFACTNSYQSPGPTSHLYTIPPWWVPFI